jgi:imidazolonepropionase-like amidohydrolase
MQLPLMIGVRGLLVYLIKMASKSWQELILPSIFSLPKELGLLVQAGLLPTEVLKAATIAPAEFFNLESEMGVLDVGKIADIVMLNNNPLTNI